MLSASSFFQYQKTMVMTSSGATIRIRTATMNRLKRKRFRTVPVIMVSPLLPRQFHCILLTSAPANRFLRCFGSACARAEKCVGFDFDQHFGRNEPADLDHGRGRADRA